MGQQCKCGEPIDTPFCPICGEQRVDIAKKLCKHFESNRRANAAKRDRCKDGSADWVKYDVLASKWSDWSEWIIDQTSVAKSGVCMPVTE